MTGVQAFRRLQEYRASQLGADGVVKARGEWGGILPPPPDAPATVAFRSRQGIMRTRQIANPGRYVRPDSTGYAALEQAAQAAGPAVVAAFEKHLPTFAFRVADAWPTDSGLSRAMLDLRYEARDGLLVATFTSRASYTRFIKSRVRAKGETKGSAANPWKALVQGAQGGIFRAVSAEAGLNVPIFARGVRRV